MAEEEPAYDEFPEESNLVKHARRELDLVESDEKFKGTLVNAVEAFASFGHSGASAEIATQYLTSLLRFENLSPLTDDPEDWEDRSEISDYPLWQSKRNSECFSEDGGKTYYKLSEGGSEAPLKYRSDKA